MALKWPLRGTLQFSWTETWHDHVCGFFLFYSFHYVKLGDKLQVWMTSFLSYPWISSISQGVSFQKCISVVSLSREPKWPGAVAKAGHPHAAPTGVLAPSQGQVHSLSASPQAGGWVEERAPWRAATVRARGSLLCWLWHGSGP